MTVKISVIDRDRLDADNMERGVQEGTLEKKSKGGVNFSFRHPTFMNAHTMFMMT